MNEYLKRFDTIRFVAIWSIFRNFLGIFHFFEFKLNFEFGPVSYRTEPEPVRTGLTGNRSNRTGSVNPEGNTELSTGCHRVPYFWIRALGHDVSGHLNAFRFPELFAIESGVQSVTLSDWMCILERVVFIEIDLFNLVQQMHAMAIVNSDTK